MQVEVVEAEDRRAAMQVKALQLRVELLHLMDELQRVSERVPHPEHPTDARIRSVGPGNRQSLRLEIAGEEVEVPLAAHAEAEPRGGRDGRVAQD